MPFRLGICAFDSNCPADDRNLISRAPSLNLVRAWFSHKAPA
jgi:hypothetical protein